MSVSSQSITNALKSLEIRAGVIPAHTCKILCEKFEISIENLMIALLPLASEYAKVPISNFNVGAVAQGADNTDASDENNSGYSNLYLGANIEFDNQALCHSIHAEQSAISIAWQAGERKIVSIATSAAPCGHCRQFLYEISAGDTLSILTPSSLSTGSLAYKAKDISFVLPNAFGPIDLNCKYPFMQPAPKAAHSVFTGEETDPLLRTAILAANASYAPYTGNVAGCSVILTCGNILSGRTVENAAFNPSLLAFSAVIIQMVMSNQSNDCLKEMFDKVKRVVLAENPKKAPQKELTKLLLSGCKPEIKLEYCRAH